MPTMEPQQNSLILYKGQPGRITKTGKKIEIELPEGERRSVRPKDVVLLHPGPLENLASLAAPTGDVETAWELLTGETTTLSDLAELAYDEFTPVTAWAVWQLLQDGLYFSGEPEAIHVHTAEELARIQGERQAKAAAEQAWDAFLTRLRHGRYEARDSHHLQDVAALAYGQRDNSKVLRALNQMESAQTAHALLLNIGYWDETINPYPHRIGLPTASPTLPLPPLPDEDRRDLTHLLSLAIDDDDNVDPDDALSLENGRLWVHIADVSALVTPDSPVDVEARGRGANLYLPEDTIGMLPLTATHMLGLGLAEVSPALSFGLDFDEQGGIVNVEITPSWVRVTRMTYTQAEAQLDQEPIAALYQLAHQYEARRRANNAVFIDLPEVKVRLIDGEVQILPLPPLRSRTLVQEAMLMTGEAVAQFALTHNIPLPFTVQDAPDIDNYQPERPSEMLALRKQLKRSQQTTTPGLHAGLGMNLYAQATSPLRRYLDLVVHQQLRAFLQGKPLLDNQMILERIGTAAAVVGSIRQAERLSNTHWKLVYLQQRPGWEGEGVILDQRGNRSIVLLPDLELETELYLKGNPALDSIIAIVSTGVDLPQLEAHFRAVAF